MKILFLHLSDAHLKDNTDLRLININGIVNSLTQIGDFDECVLVFSGDVANSGEKNAYANAGKLVGYIAKGISQKYIDGKIVQTLIVPGNHDNLIKSKNRNNLDLESYYEKKETDLRFYDDLKQLSNFYEFANRNRCFSRSKVIDVRKLKFDNFIIKANLINSAPFSLLGSGNRDKGMHYLPSAELENLNIDLHQKYTISIIHHSPEWFSDTSKHKLYNMFNESTDLLFVGHEHFSLNEDKTVNGKHIDISSGVALFGTNTEHGFNALVLDTESHTLVGYKFINNGKIYKPTKVLDNKNVIFNSNKNFKFTSEFQKELLTDTNEREGENYSKYFVFPSLEPKEMNSDLKNFTVTSEYKFKELLSLKSKIYIEGSSRTGKSILAKYLTNQLSEDYTILYLTEDSFAPKNVKNIIKYAIQNEYGDEADCDEFFQLDKEKKILIVDGSDRVAKEKWDIFMNEYSDQFGHIITFCNIDWNLNIKDRTVEELTENAFFYLKICPFYYVKREQLIKKICSSYLMEYPTLDVEEKSRKINEDITNQIKYFQLTPDFIHQFVDYYIQFSHIKTQSETNVFSKVFVANITYRISKNTKEENDIDEILIALDYVAHYIHFVKKYQKINYDEFETAVKEYKDRYDNQELNTKYVYTVAVKANILKESKNFFEIEFCDKNLLSYFVAQHLNRTCQMGEKPEDLKEVLDNICFGINGDVILFLSYITSNTQILRPILQSIYSHMNDWIELDIDKNNIEYLSKVSATSTPKLPDKKDKERIKEEKNKMEKQIIEEEKHQADSLYSYDASKVNSFSNKISKSINYLELVAKILPNFRFMLQGEEKKVITSILYVYPNKLLYFMLKDIDTNYNKIIEDILKSKPKTRKGILLTADMITRELQNQSIAYILSIYDFISMTASTSKTIGDLEKFDYNQNINYKIQNLMMQENIANFKIFAARAEQIFDTANLSIIKQMITLIVRKYFIYHDVEMHGDAIRLIDKFFGKKQRKDFQILQAKNKIIKK